MAAATPSGGGRRAPIAAINITPLVDVMLVLLVIMMVSATYIVSQTMKVDLPKTATSDGSTSTTAAVTIDAEHNVYFNRELCDDAALGDRFGALAKEDREATLMVSADAATDHGVVIHVLDLARARGVTKFAVNVERKLE